MKKRELGKSGIYISELGFGAMSLPNDINKAKSIFDTALSAGINFFDTADLYDGGKNEELVSLLLKDKRDEVILATKAGNKMQPDGNSWSWDPSKKHLSEAVKKSLTRLGTDYIDLYQLHGGMMEDDVEETIDAFESMKKEGLILQYGISSIRPNVIKRFLDKSSAVSVMMQYSLLDRRPEEWFSMIESAGASIITRGTVAKGFLTSEGTIRAKSANGFAEYNSTELQNIVELLHENTEDLHAAAVKFVLRNKEISTALIGASSAKQLLDSVKAYEKGFKDKELEQISSLVLGHKYKEHRLN